MIKINKHNVTDNKGIKARVIYSLDGRCDERKCVTIYAKDWDRSLGKLFTEYKNDTDSQSDYFDQGRVVLFEDHPLYKEARAKVESWKK